MLSLLASRARSGAKYARDPSVLQKHAFLGASIAVLAGALAFRVMPPPGGSDAAGFSGLPRLLVYAIGGLALGLTGVQCIPKLAPAWQPRWRSNAALAAGALLSIGVTWFNVLRLRQDIADPLGPALWVAAMLALVIAAIAASGPFLWRRPRPRLIWLVLGALLAYGAAIRFVDLASIPPGINPDEGDRASTALDVLDRVAPRSWFDSGWFFINMVYFRLLALCLTLFGPDIAGGRTGSAIAGTAFLVALAWLACRHFGWRIGIVAVALSTATGVALQHSRLIAETMPTGLLWLVSIACFLEGARTARPWAFAVAGLCGGLGLYFYPSARLWPVGVIVTVALIWLHTRRGRETVLLRGFALAAVGALVAAAPILVHFTGHVDEVAGRYQQTAVLDPHNQERLSYLTPPESLVRLALLQGERTLGMFDRYPDGGGFLPTGQPLFPPPLAALALVSMVFGLVRAVRDLRLAILMVWLCLGLSGVLLTVEAPDMIRAVGALPSLFVLMATVTVELVDRLLDALQHLRPSGARAVYAWLVPIAIGVLVVGTDSASYFSMFRTIPSGWGPVTREGQAVAQLGESGPVYALEANEHMLISGWVRLLAPDVQRGRIPNPGRELPVLAPPVPAVTAPRMTPEADEAMHFLMSPDPNQRVYVDLLQKLYPGGELRDAGDGRRSYSVPPNALTQSSGVLARRADGRTFHVNHFGELPTDARLPASITWSAGVLFPRSGEYEFHVVGPGSLRIDDVPVARRVLAARGMHFVELLADVPSPDQAPSLQLQEAALEPRHTYARMDAQWGLFVHVASPVPPALPSPADGVLDSTVAMAFFDPELAGGGPPNSLTWSGTLLAPTLGVYRMAFAAEDPMQLEVDHQRVEVVNVAPDAWSRVGQGSLIPLSAGPHDVRITLQVTHGGREVARWNWVPPLADGSVDASGQWSVVPPMVLRPDQPPVRALP